jgi:hypothetical protein
MLNIKWSAFAMNAHFKIQSAIQAKECWSRATDGTKDVSTRATAIGR